MKIKTKHNPRRGFLKKCGFSSVPFLFPTIGGNSLDMFEQMNFSEKDPVNFFSDGLFLSPQAYLKKLNEINNLNSIEADYYGVGGATTALEAEFAKITGKEKAIYLPSGTMANQLAIKLLNGPHTKAIVPENSHIFRDEADAAQSVHQKRLIPVGKGSAYFDLNDLKEAIDYIDNNEVFKSGLGTVVLESPIRRADGAAIPMETIKAISSYCKDEGYKMHLDGARLHLASAVTGVSVAEYSSHFDTVYISLYKYLNAAGGAMLCGDASLIDQVGHQIKIYGGSVYQNWNNTAMALHYLKGIDERWEKVLSVSNELFQELNALDGVEIIPIKNGTNIFDLKFSDGMDASVLSKKLFDEHGIILRRANGEGLVKLNINESILNQPVEVLISAWKSVVKTSRR